MTPGEGRRAVQPDGPPEDPVDDPIEWVAERQVARWRRLGTHPSRVVRLAWKTVVLVVGCTLIAIGLALAVLPGPFTIPPVLAGLAILATEFAWARDLLQRAKAYAAKAKDKAAGVRRRRA